MPMLSTWLYDKFALATLGGILCDGMVLVGRAIPLKYLTTYPDRFSIRICGYSMNAETKKPWTELSKELRQTYPFLSYNSTIYNAVITCSAACPSKVQSTAVINYISTHGFGQRYRGPYTVKNNTSISATVYEGTPDYSTARICIQWFVSYGAHCRYRKNDLPTKTCRATSEGPF